jgi:hypothetical protein
MTRRGDDITTEHVPVRGTTTQGGTPRLAESLARMGVLIDAQRVELFIARPTGMLLAGWWAALGHEVAPPASGRPLPHRWFPWSLGNLRPQNHVFVRNAAELPIRPSSRMTVGDLGMGSCLHLPLHDRVELIGAVWAFWEEARDDWPSERSPQLTDLARDALLDCT